jgi:hypothetical protein
MQSNQKNAKLVIFYLDYRLNHEGIKYTRCSPQSLTSEVCQSEEAQDNST